MPNSTKSHADKLSPQVEPVSRPNLKVEISPKTLIITLALLIGTLVAWELRTVFFLFFIAYIINAAFRPLINWMETKRIPRMLSIVLLYLVTFGVIAFFMATIFTEAFTQLTNLISQLPNIVFNIINNLNNTLPKQFALLNPELIKQNLVDIVGSLLKVDSSFFTNGITSALGVISAAASAAILVTMIVILSIYLLSRREDVFNGLVKYLSDPVKEKYSQLFNRIEEKLGSWLRAQILVMLSSSSIIWVGLTLPALFISGYTLHNYALPIAMLVFLVEIVPGTGIALGGLLSTVLALATGNVFLVIYTPLLFILTQQLESMLIIPRVMKRAIGLNPVVTILAVVAGYLLFQVLGAVLIIPIIAVIQIILEFKAEEINRSIQKGIK